MLNRFLISDEIGGLENAIPNALAIGGTCFALFIKNQRQWVSKPLEEATVEKFKGKLFFLEIHAN